MNFRSIILLFTVVILYSCNAKQGDCCNQNRQQQFTDLLFPSDSFEFQTQNVSETFDRTGYYANFGMQFLNRDDSVYLCYLNSGRDSLVFINLQSPSIVRLASLQGIQIGRFSSSLQGDTLHLIDASKFWYYGLKIDSTFQLERFQQIDLATVMNAKKYYFASNVVVNKKFVFSYPYLLIPYGRLGSKNGMDKKPILKLDIRTMEKEYLGQYPEKYLDCPIRENYPIVELDGANIVTAFLKHDGLQRINISSGLMVSMVDTTGFSNQYMCYDKDLEADLAYTSKYDLNDELNQNFFKSRDFFFLIKRLRKEEKTDPTKSAALVFDDGLKYRGAFIIPGSTNPKISFPFKNGFMILASGGKRMVYYEFDL